MQHRQVAVLRGAEVDALGQIDLALEQAPIGPHVVVLGDAAVLVFEVELGALAQPLPMLRRPGAGADHHHVALDVALVGLHRGDATVLHLVADDLRAVAAAHAVLHALLVEAPDRHVGAGIARRLLMQHQVGLLGVEVGPDAFQEVARVLADIEVGGIALVVLRLVQRDVVALLVGFADRDIADLLEAEIHRVGLPHLHALAQDRVQRLGHVEVAHAAAGEAGGARARAGLVDQHHVGAFALAALGQVLGEVIGGRHAVHAGADHDELGAVRQLGDVVQRHDRRIDRLAVLGRRHRPLAERIELVLLGRIWGLTDHLVPPKGCNRTRSRALFYLDLGRAGTLSTASFSAVSTPLWTGPHENYAIDPMLWFFGCREADRLQRLSGEQYRPK